MPLRFVPLATSAPIGPRQLGRLIQIADDARHGNSEPSMIEWLMSCAGPLFRELDARRAAMGDAPVELTVLQMARSA